MEILNSFAEWAWARHHNVLSWYVRPLFLVPFCIFAYRRSPAGMGLTLLALLSSMFWFPAPERVDPAVASALAAEREYLLGAWNLPKVLLALLVPGSLALLAAAFWRRSFPLGVALINAIVLIKVTWTFIIFDRAAALAHLVPALVGLGVVNAAVLLWRGMIRRRATR